MSFFERAIANLPPPPEPEPEPPSRSWFEPPTGVVPGQSNQRAVLFRTERAVLVLGHIEAYPTGIEFTIDLQVRRPHDHLDGTPWELHHPRVWHRAAGTAPPDEFLRLGVEFADGSTWTNIDQRYPGPDEEPAAPVVIGRGGGGGGDRWTMRYWLWPLPPAGDLIVHAAWPVHGIDDVAVTLDATELRHAAARADVVWD